MHVQNRKLFFISSFITIFIIVGSIAFFTQKYCDPILPYQEKTSPLKKSYDQIIRLIVPQQNALIGSPLIITGEAKGTWYFEASFPVELRDTDGNILANVPAQAQGEWMTETFVPFTAKLEFKEPKTATGILILKKDNPSGLPEYDDEIRVPVVFK
ncbi:MAG: Gmad2 immunoglobulin-like domain-containing protein [bacterium]